MDIDAVKQRFVEIETALGIKGYLRAPMDIAETDLPVALHYIRNATHDQITEGSLINLEDRTVVIRLLVTPVQQGISQEAEEDVEPWIDLVTKALLARPGMTSPTSTEPLANVQRMRVVSDSGIIVIPYPNEASRYLGVDFTTRIMYYSNYVLADKE